MYYFYGSRLKKFNLKMLQIYRINAINIMNLFGGTYEKLLKAGIATLCIVSMLPMTAFCASKQ